MMMSGDKESLEKEIKWAEQEMREAKHLIGLLMTKQDYLKAKLNQLVTHNGENKDE